MGASKREKEARHGNAEPYASITAVHMLAVSCRLSPEALRLWVLAHANWAPASFPKGAAGGTVILPHATMLKLGFNSPKIVVRAFNELRVIGLLVLDKPGTKPASAGGGRGEAAIWRLPNREGGANGVRLDLPASVSKPHGTVRWNAHRMRADSLALAKSSAALKVLCVLIAWRHRNNDGGLASKEPLNLSIADLAAATTLPRSTTADALETLLANEMLIESAPQSGRRARSLELAPAYRKHVRSAPRDKQNPASLDGRKTPASLPVADTKGLHPAGEAKTPGSNARSVRQGNTL